MSNPPISPLKALSYAISKEIALKLDLRGITTPGGETIDKQQELTQNFKVGWSRIANINQVDNYQTFRAETATYEVSLSFKDLKIVDKAQDFLFQTLILLSGFKPYYFFDPLSPVNCGFSEYDQDTKYLRYSATFNTGFNWNVGQDIELIEVEEFPTSYAIQIQLWNSPQFVVTNEVKVYDSGEI